MPFKKDLADLAHDARERGVHECDVHELQELLDEGAVGDQPLVIDVRERDEWERGRIPGSVHIARGVLERDLAKKAFNGRVSDDDLKRTLVCYCGGGHRSLLAAESLKQMGMLSVLSLEGGFAAWGEAGKPVEAGR
jgi:rhodanese-related sulfurtransferase